MNIIKKFGVKKFVKEIDEDIKVKFQKWDMECDIFEEIIYIGKTYTPRMDELFMDYVKQINPIIIRKPFAFPLSLSLSSRSLPQNNALENISESITINPTITETTQLNLIS